MRSNGQAFNSKRAGGEDVVIKPGRGVKEADRGRDRWKQGTRGVPGSTGSEEARRVLREEGGRDRDRGGNEPGGGPCGRRDLAIRNGGRGRDPWAGRAGASDG